MLGAAQGEFEWVLKNVDREFPRNSRQWSEFRAEGLYALGTTHAVLENNAKAESYFNQIDALSAESEPAQQVRQISQKSTENQGSAGPSTKRLMEYASVIFGKWATVASMLPKDTGIVQ